jgi:hypothetical protein
LEMKFLAEFEPFFLIGNPQSRLSFYLPSPVVHIFTEEAEQ